MAIDLLPKDLVQAERARRTKKLLIVVCAAALFVSVVLFVSLRAYLLSLGSDLKTMEEETVREQGYASDLNATALLAGEVAQKQAFLSGYFTTVDHYSTLLRVLNEAVIPGIDLTDLAAVSSKKMTISGQTQAYPTLARFLTNLVAGDGGGKLIEAAELTGVEADPQTGGAKFTADLIIKENALKEPVQ